MPFRAILRHQNPPKSPFIFSLHHKPLTHSDKKSLILYTICATTCVILQGTIKHITTWQS